MSAYFFSASFVILVACFFTSLVCGVVAFFVSWRRINAAYKHPLLKVKSFKQFPFSLQAAIYLDYFFRLVLPNVQKGMVGNANKLLSHVDARSLDFGVRWPIAGLWGGCLLGIVAMVCVWAFLLLQM